MNYLIAIIFLHSQLMTDNNWEDIDEKKFFEIIQPISQKYENANFSYQLKYESYTNKNSKTPLEVTSGFCYRFQKKLYQEYLGIRLIQDENLKIQIDSVSSLFVLESSDNKKNFEFRLSECTDLVKSAAQLTLLQNEAGTTLRIYPKDNREFMIIEIQIDFNGNLGGIIYHLNNQKANLENSNATIQRLEIKFLDWKEIFEMPSKYSISNFLKWDGKSYLPHSRFYNYEFIDFR